MANGPNSEAFVNFNSTMPINAFSINLKYLKILKRVLNFPSECAVSEAGKLKHFAQKIYIRF
jgi:hypothetical protein